MADEGWDGKVERRNNPHEYQMRNIIREELEPIREQQKEMREAQIQIEKKVTEWETVAKWFRIFVLGTVAVVATVIKAYEWLNNHLK